MLDPSVLAACSESYTNEVDLPWYGTVLLIRVCVFEASTESRWEFWLFWTELFCLSYWLVLLVCYGTFELIMSSMSFAIVKCLRCPRFTICGCSGSSPWFKLLLATSLLNVLRFYCSLPELDYPSYYALKISLLSSYVIELWLPPCLMFLCASLCCWRSLLILICEA